MSAPQMKERPASVLRAMFAGFGSLMSVMDKMRSKPAAEAPADAAATAPQTPEAPAATATATETTAEPDTVVAESTVETDAKTEPDTATAVAEPAAAAESAVEPAPAAEPVAAAETAAEPATTTEAEAAVEPGPVAALPLANYDELTVASLRARLRNLSNDDITQLVTYEQAHQDRPEVIKMFKNRLIKMTSGFQKLES
jgi:hypothetical protein